MRKIIITSREDKTPDVCSSMNKYWTAASCQTLWLSLASKASGSMDKTRLIYEPINPKYGFKVVIELPEEKPYIYTITSPMSKEELADLLNFIWLCIASETPNKYPHQKKDKVYNMRNIGFTQKELERVC